MAKARRSRITELEKKLEALENQGFAQKLLIDELEKKVDDLEKQFAYTNPLSQWYQQPIQILPTSPCVHNWTPSGHGTEYCTLCGAYTYSMSTGDVTVLKGCTYDAQGNSITIAEE